MRSGLLRCASPARSAPWLCPGGPVGVVGLNARGKESVGRLVGKKPRDQIARLPHNAQAIEDHRLDGLAHGDHPGLRVLLGGLVNDGGNPPCSEHPGRQAEMF
jgi:hypothetical protein